MVVKLLENLPTFKTNGTVIQIFIAFLKLWKFGEIHRQYVLLRTVILRKHVSGCPCHSEGLNGVVAFMVIG